MISRLGGNEEQVILFLDAAQNLSAEDIEPVVAGSRGPKVRDARSLISDIPRSAAHFAAVDSAARDLVRDVRSKLPPSATTAERVSVGSFTSLLGSAVFALTSRTQLDDDTVALVVDPFAKRLGFEWRSWGVHSATKNFWSDDPDLPDNSADPEPKAEHEGAAWAERMVAGISKELGAREQKQLARLLDPNYSARIEDDEPETDFQDLYDSYEHCFSLGAELMYGLGYLSFPVSTGLVDYEEYYALSDDESERFRKDPELALPLLEQCRRREQDGRLMQLPGSNRGTPV